MATASGTQSAQRSWEVAARAGYVVSGLLHVLIGLLALRVAFGQSGQQADQSGALAAIAATPFGSVVLWFSVLAFVALGVWQLAKAVGAGSPGRSGGSASGSDRAKAAAGPSSTWRSAFTALTFAAVGAQSSSAQTQDMTAKLMSAPGGRLLVGAVGVAVVAVGGYHVYKGATKKFLDDLRGLPPAPAGAAVRRFGVAATSARASLWRWSECSSSRRPPPLTRRSRPGSTGRCTRCGAAGGGRAARRRRCGLVAYGLYSFVRAEYGRI